MEKFNLFGIKKDSKIHNSKKKGFSIAYAIVALVVVVIAVAGLTPVLTRKLPNLSTSSIIKNPKGWYESFNAPKEGASYCKQCIIHDDCLKYNIEHPNNPKNCETLDTKWIDGYPDTIEAKDNDPCYGNPACIPYIKPPEKEGEPNPLIIAFEQYCKSNGKCGPGPREKECGLKNKPCPCDGECKFKPAKGVTKYEVFAIGGGGAAGSAVAANPYLLKYGQTYRDSVTGKAKNDLPIGSNITVDNLNIPDGEKINADFIDTNKKHTEYTDNKNLPNIANISDKCASNIFYTIDAEPNEHDEAFHTYPTEDNNAKLAIISSKQVARILKEKHKYNPNPQYRIGNRIVDYKNRYYLYTKYLGAYSYNQNPEYESMPEWLNVDGKEAKYRDGLFEDDIYNNPLNSLSYVYRSTGNCNNNYTGKGNCKTGKNGLAIKTKDIGPKGVIGEPILSKYSDAAAIACSGDAGKGQHVIYHNTGRMCDWFMGPDGDRICPANFISNSTEIQPTYIGPSSTCDGTASKEPKYCMNIPKPYRKCKKWKKNDHKICKEYEYKCTYQAHWFNRVCHYNHRVRVYVDCQCPDVSLNDNPGNCAEYENKPVKDTCYPFALQGPTPEEIMSQFNRGHSDGSGTRWRYSQDGGKTWKEHEAPYGSETWDYQQWLDYVNQHKDTIFDPEVKGGSNFSSCQRRGDYILWAAGGSSAQGICVYVNKKIDQDKLDIVKVYNNPKEGLTADVNHNPPEKSGSGGASSFIGDSVLASNSAKACINYDYKNNQNNVCCRTAGGATTGEYGKIPDTCVKGGHGVDGAPGIKGQGGGCNSGGNFAKSGPNGMLNIQNAQKGQGASGYEVDNSSHIVNGNMQGVLRAPGRYNYRYVWYMPFITKHLMFGLAGEGGEEVHTLITLTENQSLSVKPGAAALKTNYISGKNGGNGGESRVFDDEAKVKIIAHGGKGGLGSQKTDEYVLCHKSDIQSESPELPCYYKNNDDNSFKTTHAITKDGKFVGILATQPKMSTLVQSIKMSTNLKKGAPGIGAMGYGTESVSDFVCEKRHVDKWDEINGRPVMTKADVLYSDNTNQELCKGNSKIKYIIPNGAPYSSGTGAVIILW